MSTMKENDGKMVESESETVGVTEKRFPSDIFFKAKRKTQPIPADFPLILYPGAEVLDVTEHPDMGQTTVLSEIEPVKDSCTLIGDFYRKSLQATGWTIKPLDKRTFAVGRVDIPAIRGEQSITVSIWEHDADHQPDFSIIDNQKRRNIKTTSIFLDLYESDRNAK